MLKNWLENEPKETLICAVVSAISLVLSITGVLKNVLLSFPICGRSMHLQKEIQERSRSFLSNFFGRWDSLSPMIFLQRMPGISGMPWCGQITPIGIRGFGQQPLILNFF